MNYSGIRILLVEDDKFARDRVSKMILAVGCQLDTAKDAEEALEKAAKNQYDLILMDIGLPDSSGYVVCRKIREGNGKNKDTFISALTAHVDNADHNQAEWVGMNDFIVKPLKPTKLQEILAKLIHVKEHGGWTPSRPTI